MKVKALRGVCIGVNRHLKPGDTEDVDAATSTFLLGIGAVELVAEPKAEILAKDTEKEPTKPTPEKPGKKEK